MSTNFKTEIEDHSIGKILSEKNKGIRGQFLKKNGSFVNVTKEWKQQPTAIILRQANFCNIFILCLWIRIIKRSDECVQLMAFPSQILFNDINHGYKAALLKKSSLWLFSFYMNVVSHCYYQKGRGKNACSLSIFILFQLQSCILLRVRTKFLLMKYHAKRVIFEIAMRIYLTTVQPAV